VTSRVISFLRLFFDFLSQVNVGTYDAVHRKVSQSTEAEFERVVQADEYPVLTNILPSRDSFRQTAIWSSGVTAAHILESRSQDLMASSASALFWDGVD
jgi:hypothetical protein